jgi:catechol 2,3-dioxygenase
MQVKELGHVVLFVRNLEQSVHFYRDILGFKPIEGVPMRGAAVFSSGRTHHEMLLIEVGPNTPLPPRGRRAGLYHIGLKIGDSIEELRAAKTELEAAGVTIVGMSDHTVTNSLYLLDPDGNEIEIYIDVQPAIWRDNPLAIVAPTKPLYI